MEIEPQKRVAGSAKRKKRQKNIKEGKKEKKTVKKIG